MEPDTNYRFNWTEAAGPGRICPIHGSSVWSRRSAEPPPRARFTLPLGVAIGEKDTDILFPGEYGLFDFDSEEESITDLLRVLDDGLPGGSWAEVAFAATDRNWVNWARGGNFNPSGIIRIPSVFGDGTGFFGTATQRVVNVIAQPGSEGAPPLCGPGAATPP